MHYDGPSCICLQETFHGAQIPLPPRGYRVKAPSTPNLTSSTRPPGGIVMLIKNNIPYYDVPISTNLAACAARINIGREYTVCNIYIPPSQTINASEILNLTSQLPTPFLLLGDFNARNRLWGDTIENQHGRIVREFLLQTDNIVLNTGAPTHFHIQTATESCIDLSIASPDVALDFEWSPAEDTYNSDHYPIILNKLNPETNSFYRINFNFEKADWSKFRLATTVPDALSDNSADINDLTLCFTELVMKAALESIPVKNSNNQRYPIPWWSKECSRAHKARKQALRKYKRTKATEDKVALNRATAKFKKISRESRRNGWQNYVSSINPDTPIRKIWKKVKKITGKYSESRAVTLIQNDTRITDQNECSNILAQHYSKVSSNEFYTDEFNSFRVRQENRSLNFHSSNNEPYNCEITETELNVALKTTSNTAPGEDGICYPMLKNLSDSAKSFLLFIFNKIYRDEVLPDAWRKSIMIPILKPNKPATEAKSYRPISLTSSTCKLFEKIINFRMVSLLEQQNFFSNWQYGFRKCRSTADSLSKLQSDIYKAFQQKNSLIAVFFDIEKAYDTTWRHHILQTVFNIGIRGKMAIFIKNFISARTFKVRLGQALSDSCVQEQGVPQGSVLSVTLFGIAINDIANNLPFGVQANLFVDDLAIYYSSSSVNSIERKLQMAINKISDWTTKTGFKISLEKTVAVHFHRKRGLQNEPELSIKDHLISFENKAKFLGMVFDQRLYWKEHIDYLRAKCLKSLNLLKCLSKLSWGASRSSLLHIYRATTRSKLDYGCQIYGGAPPRFLKRLDAIHHLGIRLSTGAFKSSPIPSLLAEACEPPLENRRKQLTLQHFIRQQRNPFTNSAVTTNEDFNLTTTTNLVHSIPFGMHVRQLVDNLNLAIPEILPIHSAREHPWLLNDDSFCHFKLPGRKRDYPDHVIKSMFRHHQQNDHAGSLHLYTDGSKSHEGVGFGVYCNDENIMVSSRINKSSSIYTAELLAIAEAVKLLDSHDSITIFTDSLSSLQGLQDTRSSHPIINEIQNIIISNQARGREVKLCWTPSHVAITGNEKADSLAKQAILNENIINHKVPHTDVTSYIKMKIIKDWKISWENLLPLRNKLRRIKPKIEEWPSNFVRRRKLEVILCRLRIGHTRVTHRHYMSGAGENLCEHCGDIPLTVDHLLRECPQYSTKRVAFFNNSHPSMEAILGPQCNVGALVGFLAETNLINEV